ncbi:hypothetical protein CLUG_01685 [Clavispora lusitaniae ATCC 42720]|uniref:Uncharacterized protein n=1 Tax=Clavispora lusitaniae (strain ATCC 42720) TaxID=306902 RepID=C4Y0F3_CLAL4|nr:uncharacterized protein CLUG_01685 [Clavispora lusitaniae ATCC 42720]EEQ37563.1 hypothetical protein CLUG_01685 [Clavispora lusitaniae ATCC 42720]
MSTCSTNTSMYLEVDGLAESAQSSFLECLSQRWVSMAHAGNVLGGSTVFQSQASLGDHLTSVRTNDVTSQDTVSLSVRKELNKTVSVQVCLGTRVGNKWEFTNLVQNALLLQLLLGGTDPSNFWVCVHHRWNVAVVNVTMALLNELSSSNTFLLGLVSQHGAKSDVTNNTNMWFSSSVLGVNHQTSLLVSFQANGFVVQALGVWSSTNGHQQNVGIKFFSLAGLDVFNANLDHVTLTDTLGDLSAQHELQALLGQQLSCGLGNLTVHTSTNGVSELNDSDLRAQTRPHRGHFQTNDTTTNDGQLLWHFLEGQCTGRSDDSLFIHLNTWEWSSFGTSGNGDVVCSHLVFFRTVNRLDSQSVVIHKRAMTLQIRDTVLLEKHFDTQGQTFNGLVLGFLQLGDIDRNIAGNFDTTVSRVMLDLVVQVRVVQQSLGRNTSDIKTGSSKRTTGLDTGGFVIELSHLDGVHIATWSTANNYGIVVACFRRIESDKSSDVSSQHGCGKEKTLFFAWVIYPATHAGRPAIVGPDTNAPRTPAHRLSLFLQQKV